MNTTTTSTSTAVTPPKSAAEKEPTIPEPPKSAAEREPTLPEGLTEAMYVRALDFAKLSSKTYDWDDFAVAQIGMGLFSGIDDVKAQDFRTPNYVKIRGGGNDIDWWGGTDHGLDFSLFQHENNGHIVLAFRGTEPLSVEDWVEDIKQALGSSKQYEKAVELARSLQEKAREKGIRLFLTGHSLGGGLATAASLATGCEAIVFDSAGVSEHTIRSLELKVREHESSVTNFNVKECFVSDWNKKMDKTTFGTDALGIVSEQKQYGNIFWLESVSDRANFKLLPDRTRTVRRAESVLSHAWHVFTFQLEHKNFAKKREDADADAASEVKERPTKLHKSKR